MHSNDRRWYACSYSANEQMTTKVKRKMVNIEPVSSKAKNRFVNIMDSLHGCVVEQEKDNLLFLASINRKYFMWLPKDGNEHWKIVK